MKKNLALVTMGLLIAVTVVLIELGKLMSYANIARVSFDFLPVSAAAILLGPAAGACVAAAADILGFFLLPEGSYLPGITISALLAGLVYGLFLYRHRPSVWRALTASAVVSLLIDGFLTTFWLYLYFQGRTYWALFIPRIIKSAAMVPLKTFLILVLWRVLLKQRIFEKFKRG